MKLWIKIALTALASFGGGFAAGFFCHKKMNDFVFEETTKEEMQQIEESLKEKEGPKEKEYPPDDTLSTDPDKLRLQLQGKKSYIQADREAKEKYAQIWGTVKNYSSEENANDIPVEDVNEDEIDEDFIKEALEEENSENDFKSPYPIDLAAYYNERNDYDKITIDWYEPNTFVDEREEIIADIKTYTGDINLKELFKDSSYDEDPDVRFVRNEGYSTDYEIIKHHRTWEETTGMGGSE